MKKSTLFYLLSVLLINWNTNAQFFEDFNTATLPNLPTDWSSVVNSTSSQAKVETTYAINFLFPDQLQAQLKNGPDSNANLVLVTPQVTNLTTQSYQIRFFAKRNFKSSSLIVGTVPSTTGTFTSFQTIALTETATEYIIVFDSNYLLSDTYIAFKHGGGGTNQYIYIDDVTYESLPSSVPNCATNQVATQNPSCGNYELNFNWDSSTDTSGYKISIGTTSGGTDIENLADLGNLTNYTLTNPTENTSYFWTVIPYNSSGDAVGCLENTFTTASMVCYLTPHPITVEGNGITNVSVGSINNTSIPLTNAPYYEDYSNLSTDVTTGTIENISVTFETGFGYSTFLWVDWNNDLDFDDLNEMYFLGNSEADNPTTSNWNFLIPPTTTSGNKRMRIGGVYEGYGFSETNPLNPFYSTENHPFGDKAEFEDYTLNVIASNCIDPFNLSISSLYSDSIDVNWIDHNNGNTPYIVEWKEISETTWSNFVTNVGDTSYTITGLTNATDYQWRVTPNCGNNTVNGPNFTTLCLAEPAPYTYDFESNGNLDSCWRQEEFNDDFDWTVHTGSTQTSLTGPTAANTGTYYLYTESSDKNLSDKAVVYSPNIDLSSITSPSLNFYYHMYGFNMGTDANFDIAISTDGRTTYTSIFNKIGNQGNQWNEETVDLSAYSGIVNFKITATIGSNGSIFQHDFAIDDFKIEGNISCSNINYTWNGSSWSPSGTPTINDAVTISGYYNTTIFGNLDVCSLTLSTNGLLEIKSGTYVNINNEILNNGVINVFTAGSLVQINDNATVTGTGFYNTQIETTTLLDQNRYTYFSSPISNEDLTVFSSWAKMNSIYDFVGSTQQWNLTNGTESMEIGKGYTVRGSSTLNYPTTALTQFQGAFNNGIVNQTVYHNVGTNDPDSPDDDSNLVGNPYPSAIDADMLLIQNPNLEAFHIWTHATAADENGQFVITDYAVWTLGGGTFGLTGKIASGQGFFAVTNDNNPDFPETGNMVFNNSMRVTTGNNDFRNTDFDKIWLNLKDDNNTHFKQLLISFMPQGTDTYDNQYDAKTYQGDNAFDFYSLDSDTNKLLINTTSTLTDEKRIIPLGLAFEENSNTNFKISIDHLQNLENVSVYLKDNFLNSLHDLKLTDFNFNPNNEMLITNRFEIVLTRNTLSNDSHINLESDLIIANYNENQIKVKTTNGSIIKKLKAYNTLGKLIIDVTHNSNNFIINKYLNQGQILFFKVSLENGQVLTKKFVKL